MSGHTVTRDSPEVFALCEKLAAAEQRVQDMNQVAQSNIDERKEYEAENEQLREANRELTERLEELSGICQGYANEIEIGHEEYMKLHARLEAAERLLTLSGRVSRTAMEAAIELAQSTAPVKPVAGEERT